MQMMHLNNVTNHTLKLAKNVGEISCQYKFKLQFKTRS